MGAILSPVRRRFKVLCAIGLKLLNRGKVRDTYLLPDSKHLLLVCSDAVSIFDIVLNCNIPFKGIVLNMMSHFWFKFLESKAIKTHFVATGAAIDKYLPASLRDNPDLQCRAMVVKKLEMREYEFIYRNTLTGSGFRDYLASGMVCGYELPDGMQDGDLLPNPIFTPSTKADVGHDENVDATGVRKKYRKETSIGMRAFRAAIAYARKCGILLADTKFEFGVDKRGNICLGDEVLSPDSSRFWELMLWNSIQRKEKRKAPPPFDKEKVRNAGREQVIHMLCNDNLDDLKIAWAWKPSKKLIAEVSQTYRYIFWRLTGMTLEDYAWKKLRVRLPRPRKNVLIVLGSESDLTADMKKAIRRIRTKYVKTGRIGSIRVITNFSCHRQTGIVITFAQGRLRQLKLSDYDIIVAGAGWAAALPGILDSALAAYGNERPVVGLALGTPGTKEFSAAKLSISCLPGSHVIMDELTGRVYTNVDGLTTALTRIATGELPAQKRRTVKPINWNAEITA